MPYISKWVEPDVFLTHKGVTIYRIYKNDCIENGYRTFWFGYAPSCDDEGTDCFDVRGLPTYKDSDSAEDAMIEAIDLGFLTDKGVCENPIDPNAKNVIIVVQGGVVQNVLIDDKNINSIVIDYDTEGASEDEINHSLEDEAIIFQYPQEYNPDEVENILVKLGNVYRGKI